MIGQDFTHIFCSLWWWWVGWCGQAQCCEENKGQVIGEECAQREYVLQICLCLALSGPYVLSYPGTTCWSQAWGGTKCLSLQIKVLSICFLTQQSFLSTSVLTGFKKVIVRLKKNNNIQQLTAYKSNVPIHTVY